ncbi:hypothetical protein [Acetobacterium woodii]|uniref:Uncharacterized protein n=1 Tax=Acetobacterium woodii (strain ATCC 29683 / DSM 1030 / JCM 2381 / KCTC 1655 / WB1) TaxID=931626 RepID=H6LGY6_ACEWD|nr:hypothetical protein [Acetobacterium woodii]AFA47124.1 hypothetical protein Awo_c03200 [Acetobacterium woodii DSM 1030]
MKLKPNYAITIVLIILVVGIGGAVALGLWNTQTEKVPITFTSGENAGEYNPSDIRGSYTFEDISVLFEIPLDSLGKAFNVTENVATFQCKTLESMYQKSPVEIGTGSVRFFVAAYKGFEIDPKDAYLLEAGRDVILSEGSPTASQIDYLNTHFVTASELNAETTPATNTESGTGTGTGTGTGSGSGTGENADKLVKGKTTFAEAISLGISQAKIETAIGGPIPDMSMTIKDYCNANGLDFSVISVQIAE